MRAILSLSACFVLFSAVPGVADAQLNASDWTIYVTNDNCPDYTWGLTEAQTRQAFADVVRGHLDEMNRTDGQPFENRDRYNAAVTQEVLCFVERYPERKEELVRRIKEGRLYVSPYLCNSLWAFQGVEGALRTFYPARRLERDWGISIDCAHHIELPSLPWGTPTLLAGCGIKHLSLPYLGYDCTFGALKTPPLFVHEGPDGSRVRVALDRFASGKANYTQGAKMLGKPEAIEKDWLSHYAGLGAAYPLRAILASGTHGDISPGSGAQARRFAEGILQYNAQPGVHAKLVNATFPQFWAAMEKQEAQKAWLPTIRGDFGHSWDLWPVCLAKYVADVREGERALLAAEALLAMAACVQPEVHRTTRADREQAEWCWAMLSDHAWNGTNADNQRHNAELRRRWSEQLNRIARELTAKAWSALEVQASRTEVTLFNPLSFARKGLVRIEPSGTDAAVVDQGRAVPCQVLTEDGRQVLCFVSPEVPGFGFRSWRLASRKLPLREAEGSLGRPLTATNTQVESPYYRATVDLKTGGLSSLVHKASGTELIASGRHRGLCQTVYFDGQEHTLSDIKSEVVAQGPVLARLRIRGSAAGIEVANDVTVYAELDQIDFDLRIHKPVSTNQQRLCQVFPFLRDGATLRIATPGAVIRPRPQPQGDLLPGADTRRFAVQEYLDVSSEEIGVTLAPVDAFVLRMDLDPVSIEAVGNDQNYKEVVKDQNGVTQFRFRYPMFSFALRKSLRHKGRILD